MADFMFPNVAYRATVYRTGVKTKKWLETCVGPLSPHIHCNVESQLPAKAALVNSKSSSSSSSWIKIHGNVRTWSVKNNEWLHTMLDYFNQGSRVFKLSSIFIIYLSSKESFSQTVKQVTTKCRVWQLKKIFFKDKRKYLLFGLFYYDILFCIMHSREWEHMLIFRKYTYRRL